MLRIIGLSSCLPDGIEVVLGDQVYHIFIVDLLARSTKFLTSAASWEPAHRRGADQSGMPCGHRTQSARDCVCNIERAEMEEAALDDA
jgi:hypothetical protein